MPRYRLFFSRAQSVRAGLLGALLAVVVTVGGCRTPYSPVVSVETLFLKGPAVLNMAGDTERLNTAAVLAISELKRLEEMFSPLNTQGSLYLLNETRTLRDPELYPILERAQWISELTEGGLNIFMGYLETAYGFSKEFPRPPGPDALRELLLPLRRASMEFIPERRQVRIPNDAYAIALTGIQEGFAADQVLGHIILAGLQIASVRIGSHLACGASPDGLGWPVQIKHPATDEVVVRLYVEYSCVATASVNDHAYTFRDRAYHIHLDPTTGLPAQTLSLVSVVAPSCELAAGLAMGIFTMVAEKGLRLINDLPEVDGVLIEPDGTVSTSDSLFIWLGS